MRCFALLVLSLLCSCVARGGVDELGPRAALTLAEQVRHLARTGPIRATWIDQRDLRAHIAGLLTVEERTSSDTFGAIMRDLGFDVGERPLSEQLLDAMGTQVAGFYDPKVKTLYGVVRPGAQPLETTTVLIHEAVHALQDQHGMLADLDASPPGLDDLQAAKQAMVEGDATLAMIAGLARWQGQTEAQVQQTLTMAGIAIGSAISGIIDQSKLPPIVGEALVFPYAGGFTYLLFGPMKDGGGWAAVDRALLAPPLSTELVLHPNKSPGDDPPVFVSFDVTHELTAGTGITWEPAPVTVLGERWQRFIFGQKGQDLRAATGWGGDLVQHYRERQSGQTITVVGTTWDTTKDADEAASAWSAWGLDVVQEQNRVIIVGGPGNRTLVPGAVGRAALRTWRQAKIRSRADALAFIHGA